ncbi:MAG: adenylate/guanylate cyclase domain-containing protein [Bacteroidota bacterium]
MKSAKLLGPFLLMYLTGINLYYCLWYLGSEMSAVEWTYKQLSFKHLWINSNVSSVLLFATLVLYRWCNVNLVKRQLSLRRLRIWKQWVAGNALFLLFTMIGIGLVLPKSQVLNYATTSTFLSLSIYHFCLFMVLVSILNLSERVGGIHWVVSHLSKVLAGPRRQERGFIFLDLNNSTEIAETLKSEKYSAFIRYCFRLLDRVVEKNNGIEIYQYVGDEATLHWNFNIEGNSDKAIRLFQDFKSLLDSYAYVFESEFGIKPSFKAAIHGGVVVKSELGSNVIHTVFHGDVVNTTSRILDMCHQFQTDLLVSEACYKNLNKSNLGESFQRIDDVVLNGKSETIVVYRSLRTHPGGHNVTATLQMA